MSIFVKKCYADYLDYCQSDNNIMMDKLRRIIQVDIFNKICKIYRDILNLIINFPKDFEKLGFLTIFLKKREHN